MRTQLSFLKSAAAMLSHLNSLFDESLCRGSQVVVSLGWVLFWWSSGVGGFIGVGGVLVGFRDWRLVNGSSCDSPVELTLRRGGVSHFWKWAPTPSAAGGLLGLGRRHGRGLTYLSNFISLQ